MGTTNGKQTSPMVTHVLKEIANNCHLSSILMQRSNMELRMQGRSATEKSTEDQREVERGVKSVHHHSRESRPDEGLAAPMPLSCVTGSRWTSIRRPGMQT